MSSEDQDSLQSPVRSLRQRKSVDYSEQGLASRSRRNSSVRASTVPDLDFIREGDEVETDENDEAFIPSSALNEAQDGSGKELFGFHTPKKAGAMAMKVAEEMRRTPLSEKNTPSKKTTPYKSSSNPTTPIRGIMKTPTSGKKRTGRFEPETPMSAKKRVKQTIIKISETHVTHNYSDQSDTEEEEEEEVESEEERPIIKGPPATPRTPARRGRRAKPGRELDQHNMAESYFSAQSQPVHTSDRTLAKLKTPRLSDTEVNKLLKSSKQKYDNEVHSSIRYSIFYKYCSDKGAAERSPGPVPALDVITAQRLLHCLLRPRLQEKFASQVPRRVSAREGLRGC